MPLSFDLYGSTIHLWDPAWAKIALEMCLSVLLGGLIGLERSRHGRQAGFRTYSLVCLAATALVAIIPHGHAAISMGDPASRVIQGLLTGVGFLGAGLIIKDGLSVKGLTTAASVWLTSALGVLIGSGMIGAALFMALLTLLILSVFRKAEDIIVRDRYSQIAIRFQKGSEMSEEDVKALLASFGLKVVEVAFKYSESKSLEMTLAALYSSQGAPNRLAREPMARETIASFRISAVPE